MVIAVEDIVDGNSLEAWLKERPEDLRRQCALFVASRAAARVAPLAWDWFQFDPVAIRHRFTSLPLCRSQLTSVLAFLVPNDVNLSAANAGRAAADDIASARLVDDVADPVDKFPTVEAAASAASAAALTATVADAAAYAVSAVEAADYAMDYAHYAVIRADCQLWLDLEGAGDIDIARLQSAPLWQGESPLETDWADLKAELISDATSDDSRGADWSFWIDWYERLLEGRAQNIDMLLEIVTSDKINWKAPSLVNKAISAIFNEFERPELHAALIQMADLQLALEAEEQKHRDETAALNNKHEAELQSVVAQVAIKGPSKLWNDKRDEHKEKSQTAYRLFIGALVVMAIALGGVAYCLIWGDIDKLLQPYGCDLQFAPELCGGFSLKGTIVSILFATILALGFGFIRLQLKVFLSERHLMLDARERMAFADAYVSLLRNKDNAEGAAEQGLIVYNALFRPTSDGIIKEDGGVDPSLSAAIAKFLAK